MESYDLKEVEVVADPRHRRRRVPNQDTPGLQAFLRQSRAETEPLLGTVLGPEGESPWT